VPKRIRTVLNQVVPDEPNRLVSHLTPLTDNAKQRPSNIWGVGEHRLESAGQVA
jgi:hypothetical protein